MGREAGFFATRHLLSRRHKGGTTTALGSTMRMDDINRHKKTAGFSGQDHLYHSAVCFLQARTKQLGSELVVVSLPFVKSSIQRTQLPDALRCGRLRSVLD
jgi:hypothetical protein